MIKSSDCQDNDLSAEELKALLHFNPDTGVFTRAVSLRRWKAGEIAGSVNSIGYWQIRIKGKNRYGHRLAWLYVYGCFPEEQIDHINGNRLDNRISNLRKASPSENNQNRVSQRGSYSRFLGVSWNRNLNKWHASISKNRKRNHLGFFDSEEDAGLAYTRAKLEMHEFNPVIRERMRSQI